MADNRKIAVDVLEAVGGKDNVTSVTHCATRLRFILKDAGIAKEEEIKKIPGVLGMMKSGGQTQIIIGQNVSRVYQELCDINGFAKQAEVSDVDGTAEKKKITLKSIGMGILEGLSGSLTPIIPAIVAASLFKMIVAVFGPDMLGVMNAEGDLYKLCVMVGDAGYYFFPVLIGYTAAKKFGVTPVLGILLGGIMLHPTLVQMAADGTAFTVFGIPCKVQNYSSTLLPIILSVYVMSYVEKFFKKYVPESLTTMLTPMLTIVVMLPIALCILGPAGAFLGTYICGALIAFSNVFGFIGAAVVGGLWEFLVMTGMHQVMITQMIMVFAEAGSDPVISVGAFTASMAIPGMCLGMAFALKNKDEKNLSLSYILTAVVGGITEPGLYGVGMRYRKALIGMVAGGFFGGLYAGITGAKACAFVPLASILGVSMFAGGSVANLVNGVIASAISIVVAAVVTYVVCREKK